MVKIGFFFWKGKQVYTNMINFVIFYQLSIKYSTFYPPKKKTHDNHELILKIFKISYDNYEFILKIFTYAKLALSAKKNEIFILQSKGLDVSSLKGHEIHKSESFIT